MSAVSIREVARRAGVSVGTVSNVLNRPGQVTEVTVARVNAAIAELGYVRNDAARHLRAGQSTSIGFVVLDVGNPFFTDLARGAEEAAARQGYSLLLANSDEDAAREAAYLELFEQQRVSGVLISPIGDVDARLIELAGRGIGTVLVDRTSDSEQIASVSVDDLAGGMLAARHLLGTGRRRIAFVGGPQSIRQVQERLAGARRAVAEIPDAALEVIATESLTVLQGRAAGQRILQRSPEQRPDAVFAANDLLAMGVLQAFVLDPSVRVPEDIALIGYDDIDFASAAMVPLSSIRQPAELMGRTAVELLLEATQRQAARQVVYTPELVVRDSTASAHDLPPGSAPSSRD